ncbi:DUF2231 domain-containing protein [Nocardia vaccinii]|uniref:DUF2231 domain-containing protein n=1 Tax=Nocardia vaccinii TaxID=1822 RepID=UPI000A412AEB|nr:DUF2231 domain-containing protein [Nocardia vaccinii]
MTSESQRGKRPLAAMLTGPYGHPFHPILVTVPIGAWIASLVFDIGSHVVDDPDFLARGALWLIAIGVIGALVAAAVGTLDLVTIPTRTPAFRTGLLHMGLNLAVLVAFVVGFLWRYDSGGPYDATAAGPLVLSIIALLVLGGSGYLGGKLAYHYGVRVADEATQATGFERP